MRLILVLRWLLKLLVVRGAALWRLVRAPVAPPPVVGDVAGLERAAVLDAVAGRVRAGAAAGGATGGAGVRGA